MVFLNSPCRETPKNVLQKKVKKKKVGWWVGGSEIQQMCGGVRRFCFGGPSVSGGAIDHRGSAPQKSQGLRAERRINADDAHRDGAMLMVHTEMVQC
jgi:hypothetical protein